MISIYRYEHKGKEYTGIRQGFDYSVTVEFIVSFCLIIKLNILWKHTINSLYNKQN